MSTLLKSELDWQNSIIEAKREGRNEEKINIVRSLKELGISTDIISKSTGLSPEKIELL
ncbi:MAG: hypothetical protein LBB81_10530 [Treponema sp.]|jgi:hypothetical protein|nr:hypothetical protein [Treponema sp.]